MTRVTAFVALFCVASMTLAAAGVTPVPARVKAPSVLDRPVGELKLDKVPLLDALDLLRDSAQVNLHVNWKALEAAGVTKETAVSVRLTGLPVRKALNYVLQGASPATWFVDDGIVEVTTQEIADKHMYTRVYPVDDLVIEIPDFYGPQFSLQNASQGSSGGGGQSPFQNQNQQQQPQQKQPQTKDERGQGIVDMITQSIRPDVWKINGGNATIAYYRGSLVVTAPRQVHEAISSR